MAPPGKKVLHLITRLDRGGSAQNTLDTCTGLSHQYRTTLIHGPSDESAMTAEEQNAVDRAVQKARDRGVTVICLPTLIRRIDPVFDGKALWALFRIIRQQSPDIVHTHTSKAGVLGRWAAFAAWVPHIVHTPHGHVFYGHFGQIATRIFLLTERLSARITHQLIALTEQEKHDHIALGVLPKDGITVIHSGVPVNRFLHAAVNIDDKKRALGLPLDAPVVGTVGWLLPIKDPATLLKSMTIVWRRHPNVQLVYVGKGDLEVDLKTHALEAGVQDRVHFLGWRNDIHEILPIFDIFALPSRNEGMGRVIVEAMAAGKPVVASRTGGIPDLVEHGRTGWLVPPGDHHALGEALLDSLDHPDRAKQMGDAGRGRCRRFSRDLMLRRLHNVYASLQPPSRKHIA